MQHCAQLLRMMLHWQRLDCISMDSLRHAVPTHLRPALSSSFLQQGSLCATCLVQANQHSSPCMPVTLKISLLLQCKQHACSSTARATCPVSRAAPLQNQLPLICLQGLLQAYARKLAALAAVAAAAALGVPAACCWLGRPHGSQLCPSSCCHHQHHPQASQVQQHCRQQQHVLHEACSLQHLSSRQSHSSAAGGMVGKVRAAAVRGNMRRLLLCM